MSEQRTKQFTIEDLIYLMQRLRHPETGCPWDLKQSFSTIVPHTIEETYEVVDAIERSDWHHLKEELGDLLFQVIFYSQLGAEENLFDWHEVVHLIVEKLVRRHPHVFPKGDLLQTIGEGSSLNDSEIKANWEEIKAQEKREKHANKDGQNNDLVSLLADIPRPLPAMDRALKIQKKVAKVGFDWPDVVSVIENLKGEISELEQELSAENVDQSKLEDEMADVLFSCVNVSRSLNFNPESALRKANQKFAKRFERVEQLLFDKGKKVDQATTEEMNLYWEQAKKEGL